MFRRDEKEWSRGDFAAFWGSAPKKEAMRLRKTDLMQLSSYIMPPS
jgi:hypothetical protein